MCCIVYLASPVALFFRVPPLKLLAWLLCLRSNHTTAFESQLPVIGQRAGFSGWPRFPRAIIYTCHGLNPNVVNKQDICLSIDLIQCNPVCWWFLIGGNRKDRFTNASNLTEAEYISIKSDENLADLTGHRKNMSGNRIQRQIVFAELETETRPRSDQRKRFKDYITNHLTRWNIAISNGR